MVCKLFKVKYFPSILKGYLQFPRHFKVGMPLEIGDEMSLGCAMMNT